VAKSGWYWHVHHERLVEWCYDYDKRAAYIKAEKPADEVETRLRLFKPVAGPIPERLQSAGAEWRRADAEWQRAYDGLHSADAELRRADDELHSADDELQSADAECLPTLEALHAVECPGCPWDGKTIFPQR
jgi:hypothetical protein